MMMILVVVVVVVVVVVAAAVAAIAAAAVVLVVVVMYSFVCCFPKLEHISRYKAKTKILLKTNSRFSLTHEFAFCDQLNAGLPVDDEKHLNLCGRVG